MVDRKNPFNKLAKYLYKKQNIDLAEENKQ